MQKNALHIALIVLIVFGLSSILLPLVNVQVPIIGKQSISVFQSVKDSALKPKKASKGPSISIPKPENIPGISKIKDTVIKSLKDQGIQIFKEKPSFLIVPIGIVSGVLAHILLIVALVMILTKKYGAVFVSAASTCVLSILFIISLFMVNDLVQYVLAGPLRKMENNPLSKLTSMATPGVTITPGAAAYVILVSALLMAAVSLFIKRKTA